MCVSLVVICLGCFVLVILAVYQDINNNKSLSLFFTLPDDLVEEQIQAVNAFLNDSFVLYFIISVECISKRRTKRGNYSFNK